MTLTPAKAHTRCSRSMMHGSSAEKSTVPVAAKPESATWASGFSGSKHGNRFLCGLNDASRLTLQSMYHRDAAPRSLATKPRFSSQLKHVVTIVAVNAGQNHRDNTLLSRGNDGCADQFFIK